MDTTKPSLSNLFMQLGLGSSDQEIQEFIRAHSSLSNATCLADAQFWTVAQSAFLREAIAQDAHWAIVVGQLDALLRINTAEGHQP